MIYIIAMVGSRQQKPLSPAEIHNIMRSRQSGHMYKMEVGAQKIKLKYDKVKCCKEDAKTLFDMGKFARTLDNLVLGVN
uniref:Uncharacterized protein n=1 Tax=Pithovirus LCPAC101 TaxID=2506586 RepID=A0A481Z2M3_9VIRU|nr:MAG: hypothetical protein LCPAC101_02460 [Pithovirus LCPAC101]